MTETKRIGFFLPVLFLLIFAVVFHPSFQDYFLKSDTPLEFILLSPQTFFLLAAAFIISKKKLQLKDLGLSSVQWKRNIGIGSVVGLTPYVLLFTANWIVSHVRPDSNPAEPIEWNTWIMFSMLVLAPISEEIFFRGILFQALKESYSRNVAIIASSLLFMACHSPMMVGPLMLGLITAYITDKTRSLWPAIIFHALSNGLPLFFVNYCPHMMQFHKWIFLKF